VSELHLAEEHHHYEAAREPYPRVAMLALDALLRKKAAVTVHAR
jgi:hypothetical protein